LSICVLPATPALFQHPSDCLSDQL
jgi:hypothetical protein